MQLAETWGEEYLPRLQDIAARRLNLRIRMLGGSSVGYARMTRHWWAPVRGTLAEHALEDRPMYFVSSNPHSLVNLVSGTARRREDGGDRLGRARRARRPARRARRVPRRPHRRLVGELPLLLGAGLLRGPAVGAARGAVGGGAGGRHHAHLLADRAARLRAGDRARLARSALARPAARRHRRREARALPRGDRQHRVSARARRLQHPARDHRGARHAARRLRPRQGGDAERRRRRRDDLLGHPRRALGLDVLARQRVRGRRTSRRT